MDSDGMRRHLSVSHALGRRLTIAEVSTPERRGERLLDVSPELDQAIFQAIRQQAALASRPDTSGNAEQIELGMRDFL